MTPALQRALADTGLAAARLTLICVGAGTGYALADRLLTRLTIPVALIATAGILTLAAGWWVTVRTGHDLTRLQHDHEDDQHTIQAMKATAHRGELERRRQAAIIDHLTREMSRQGLPVTMPLPRPARLTSSQVLDEQPTGGER